MVYKPRRKQTNWRDYLTEDEAEFIEAAEKVINACRADMRKFAPQRQAIQNRATQRRRYDTAARDASQRKRAK